MARIKLHDTNQLPISMQPTASTEHTPASTVQQIAYKQSIVSNVPLHPNRLVVRDNYVTSSSNENNSFGYTPKRDGTFSAVQPKLNQAKSARLSARREQLARQRLEEEEILREARDKEYLERRRIIEENFEREYALILLRYFDTKGNFSDDFNNKPNVVSVVNPMIKTRALVQASAVIKPVVLHSPQLLSGKLDTQIKILSKVNILAKSKVTTSSDNNNRAFGFIYKPYKLKNRSLGSKSLLVKQNCINQAELLNASIALVISNGACTIKSETTNQMRISRSTFVNETSSSYAEYIPWTAETCTENVGSSSSVSKSSLVVTTNQSHELDWLETIDQTAKQPNQNKILLANSTTNDSQPRDFNYIGGAPPRLIQKWAKTGGAPPWLNQKWAENQEAKDQNFVSASNTRSSDNVKSKTHSSIANQFTASIIAPQPIMEVSETTAVQTKFVGIIRNNVEPCKRTSKSPSTKASLLYTKSTQVVSSLTSPTNAARYYGHTARIWSFKPSNAPNMQQNIWNEESSVSNWSSQWKNPSNGRPNLNLLNATPPPSTTKRSVAVSKLVEDSNLNNSLMPTNDQATPENDRSNGIMVEPRLIQQAASNELRSKFVISEQMFISTQYPLSTKQMGLSTIKSFLLTHRLSNVGLNLTPIEIISNYHIHRLRELLVISSVTSSSSIRSSQGFLSNYQTFILVNPYVNPSSTKIRPKISLAADIQLFWADNQPFMATIIAPTSKRQVLMNSKQPGDSRYIGGAPPKFVQKWAYDSLQTRSIENSINVRTYIPKSIGNEGWPNNVIVDITLRSANSNQIYFGRHQSLVSQNQWIARFNPVQHNLSIFNKVQMNSRTFSRNGLHLQSSSNTPTAVLQSQRFVTNNPKLSKIGPLNFTGQSKNPNKQINLFKKFDHFHNLDSQLQTIHPTNRHNTNSQQITNSINQMLSMAMVASIILMISKGFVSLVVRAILSIANSVSRFSQTRASLIQSSTHQHYSLNARLESAILAMDITVGTPPDFIKKWVENGGAPPWLNQKWAANQSSESAIEWIINIRRNHSEKMCSNVLTHCEANLPITELWLSVQDAALEDCRLSFKVNKRATKGQVTLNYQMRYYGSYNLLVTSSTSVGSHQVFLLNIQRLILVNSHINPPPSSTTQPTSYTTAACDIGLSLGSSKEFTSNKFSSSPKGQSVSSNRNGIQLISTTFRLSSISTYLQSKIQTFWQSEFNFRSPTIGKSNSQSRRTHAYSQSVQSSSSNFQRSLTISNIVASIRPSLSWETQSEYSARELLPQMKHPVMTLPRHNKITKLIKDNYHRYEKHFNHQKSIRDTRKSPNRGSSSHDEMVPVFESEVHKTLHLEYQRRRCHWK